MHRHHGLRSQRQVARDPAVEEEPRPDEISRVLRPACRRRARRRVQRTPRAFRKSGDALPEALPLLARRLGVRSIGGVVVRVGALPQEIGLARLQDPGEPALRVAIVEAATANPRIDLQVERQLAFQTPGHTAPALQRLQVADGRGQPRLCREI